MPTSNLRASFDARTSITFQNTNYGEQRFLAISWGAGVPAERSYLSFAGLPELGAIVTSATLRVWLKGANWSGTNDITARQVTSSWKESQITWDNDPDLALSPQYTVSVVDGVDGQSVDLDVTGILDDAMNGSPAWHGIALQTTSGNTLQRQLYSSEASDPTQRPLLVIEWSSLPDAPSDLSPSGGKRVSLAKPTLSWHFRDADGDEQTAFQVQIEDNSTTQADGSFATPEYDSGWIASNAEEFDLSLAGTGTALPTFVAAGTVASGTGDITPGLPVGWAKDDILLAFAESDSADPGPAKPTGYEHVTGSPVVGTGTRLSVFWKRATSVEDAPTLGDVGNHLLARIAAFRGCPTVGFPWEITQTSAEATSDTTGSAAGPTTTQANCLIVIAATSNFDPGADDTAGYSAFTNAALASLTERIDNRAAAGNGGTLGVATGTKATAGAVGSTTYTLANAGSKAHLVIALQPSGAYGSTYVGVSADATRYWIARAKDEQGNISPWADVESFTRTTKGTFAINSPTNGGTVEETSPPIITTLTGRAQEAISYLLEEYDSDDSEWVEVWAQDRRAAPANSGSAYNFGIPSGKIKKLSTNYRLTVRSWDTFDRDATPGDPTYVQAQSTFTFVRSATPSPVTVLDVTQEAGNGPGVLLTFNRAAGQASPDYFALVVDGERVMDRIDPANIIDGGDPIVFSFVHYGVEPYDSRTYEVEAVTVVSGALKHSQSNATDTFTSQPQGIWLLDDSDPPYRPANPPRRVRIEGTANPSLGIGESGATYKPVGRRDPVTVIDAIGGYEGTVTGRIRGADPVQSGGIATFRWMKRPRNVGRRLRLISGGLSVPVELGAVDNFSPVGDAGAVRSYDVSFAVTQIDEFGEIE